MGWCKANADGAYHADSGRSGGGAILWDHHGGFLAGACHFFPHVFDAEGVELLACRRALCLAQEAGVMKVILETDSVEVASKLTREEQDRSFYGPLVDEIRSLLRGFGDFSVRPVRRTANEAAHRLAKEGCENKMCNTWFGDPPECIVNRLVLDALVIE